jgi:hypothetical protein
MRTKIEILLAIILIATITILCFKIKNLKDTVAERDTNHRTELIEIKDHYAHEQDSLKLLYKEAKIVIDSLKREILRIKELNDYLEMELEKAVAEVDFITEDSSYQATQALLPFDFFAPKEFGYSGIQVKDIHRTIIKKEYLDSINIQANKMADLLHETVDKQEDNILILQDNIRSLEQERDSISVKTEEILQDLEGTQAERDKFQKRSRFFGTTTGVTGTILLIGTIIILL